MGQHRVDKGKRVLVTFDVLIGHPVVNCHPEGGVKALGVLFGMKTGHDTVGMFVVAREILPLANRSATWVLICSLRCSGTSRLRVVNWGATVVFRS